MYCGVCLLPNDNYLYDVFCIILVSSYIYLGYMLEGSTIRYLRAYRFVAHRLCMKGRHGIGSANKCQDLVHRFSLASILTCVDRVNYVFYNEQDKLWRWYLYFCCIAGYALFGIFILQLLSTLYKPLQNSLAGIAALGSLICVLSLYCIFIVIALRVYLLEHFVARTVRKDCCPDCGYPLFWQDDVKAGRRCPECGWNVAGTAEVQITNEDNVSKT